MLTLKQVIIWPECPATSICLKNQRLKLSPRVPRCYADSPLSMRHNLKAELDQIIAAAPLRHMVTPGGFRMSVAMTNCGSAGWITRPQGLSL